MKHILIAIFTISQFSLLGQIGGKIKYSRANYSHITQSLHWEEGLSSNFDKISMGAYYRYQFEGTGFEILPGINYTKFITASDKYDISNFSFEIPFLVYPLNMGGDCGCPDFSLRNKFFEKHFFFLLTPTLLYEQKTFEENTNQNLYYMVSLGVGMSIPITERFSLAPALNYSWAMSDKWDSSLLVENNKTISSGYSEPSFELRINYKFGE